jgi:hypothetical protein
LAADTPAPATFAAVAPREERAWLLRSRFDSSPIPGTLSLADGRLAFAPDDAGGLGRHEFDVELASCEVTWPLTGGGALMVVRSGRHKWIVSHDEPAHGKLATTIGPIFARGRATDWKRALAEAAGDPAAGAEPAPSA